MAQAPVHKDVEIVAKPTGRASVKSWFDRLEAELLPQAERARILDHNASVGSIREFLVDRLLKQLLPASTVYGTGHVISATGNQSRQQDIILYDPRFPAFRFENGAGLYPIEGVIATIEIKSELTRNELFKALDGSLSVLELPTDVMKEDHDAAIAAVGDGEDERRSAAEMLFWAAAPRTYVFALRGLNSIDSLANATNAWLESAGFPGTPSRPFLPGVICSGGAISSAWGDPVAIHNMVPAATTDENDLSVTTPYALCWESDKRFGWLATHLLYTFQKRWLHGVPSDLVRRSLDRYFSFQEYFEEATHGKQYAVLGRTSQGTPGRDDV